MIGHNHWNVGSCAVTVGLCRLVNTWVGGGGGGGDGGSGGGGVQIHFLVGPNFELS